MSLKDELMKMSPELLEKAFEFAAQALNDADVIKSASKDVGVPVAEGYAIAQLFVELGIIGSTSITNTDELASAAGGIKSSMPNLN